MHDYHEYQDKFLSYMKKPVYVFWALIILAVIAGSSVVINRLRIENTYNNVELVMSYRALRTLSFNNGFQFDRLLELVGRAGVKSIAMEERTFDSIVNEGNMTYLMGYEIMNSNRLSKNYKNIMSFLSTNVQISPNCCYLVIDEASLYEDVRNNLVLQLGIDRVKEVGWSILEVKGSLEELRLLTLGFDKTMIKTLGDMGFQVIPRLTNNYMLDEKEIGLKFSEIKNIGVTVEKIMFEGDSVMGYPNNLESTAQKFLKHDFIFGYIEFTHQKGDIDLAGFIPEQTVRVHSIPDNELLTYDVPRAVKRLFRAVHERNIKVLFINPFVNKELGVDLISLNVQYITQLSDALQKHGYKVDYVKSINYSNLVSVGPVRKILVMAGVVSLLMLFVNLINEMAWYRSYFIAGGLLIICSLTSEVLMYDISSFLALLVALCFPAYAIISQFPLNKYQENYTNYQITIKVINIYLMSLCGALMVVSLLYSPQYLVGLDIFGGVKLAFIVPLLFTGLYFFVGPHRFKSFFYVLRRAVVQPITNGYLGLLIVFIIMIIFYITRSGNSFVIPMSRYEIFGRELLEGLLYARPRTKEILLAYPMCVFALYGFNKFFKFNKVWLYATAATIGPISVINTFAHIHAPLQVSFYRSIMGLAIGSLLGVALVFIVVMARKFFVMLDKE